jgi:hypothetical protein
MQRPFLGARRGSRSPHELLYGKARATHSSCRGVRTPDNPGFNANIKEIQVMLRKIEETP